MTEYRDFRHHRPGLAESSSWMAQSLRWHELASAGNCASIVIDKGGKRR